MQLELELLGAIPEGGAVVTANTLGLEMGLWTDGVIVVPPGEGGVTSEIRVLDREVQARHSRVMVPYGTAGSEKRFGVTFESMGRGHRENAAFFDAAGVALALEEHEVGPG